MRGNQISKRFRYTLSNVKEYLSNYEKFDNNISKNIKIIKDA